MNANDLFRAIGGVEESLVCAAMEERVAPPVKKWLPIALCAVFAGAAVCTGALWWTRSTIQTEHSRPSTAAVTSSEVSTQSAEEVKLPLLEIPDSVSDGMGFEGYMAYDISELVSANPWTEEMELSTLPVFRNPITYTTKHHILTGADFDKMRAFLLEIASRLGLDEDSLTITDNAPDEEEIQKSKEKMEIAGTSVPDEYYAPTILIGKANGIQIEVDAFLTADISFEPAVSLPDSLEFSHYASYEQISAVAEYLLETYPALIGAQNPQTNISGGEYDLYRQQKYSISFFDANGTDTDRILHYNFNETAFYCDDDGKLFLARVHYPDLSDKIGDYPIISVEEAEKLLESCNYITSVPYEMPGSEYIKKAELIYRTGTQESYYMPYYRFYVELPEEENEDGMKTYGAYYVPAVSGEYLANMPVWDGSFH